MLLQSPLEEVPHPSRPSRRVGPAECPDSRPATDFERNPNLESPEPPKNLPSIEPVSPITNGNKPRDAHVQSGDNECEGRGASKIKRMRKLAFQLGSVLMASLTIGLFVLRVQHFYELHPHVLEFAIVASFITTAVLFYMASGENGEPSSGHISESAQSNPTIIGSTISGSMIDASATTHHHNRGISGKYLALIILAMMIGAGVYLYLHRRDADCKSSNGDAVASGAGSKAVDGNCNDVK